MKGNGTIAPLANVALFTELLERVKDRPKHLPGMATFHGWSGFGKTFSAVYGANKHNAAYVEVGSSWTKKRFMEGVCVELGVKPAGTIAAMVDQAVEALVIDDRPLIIDEADFLVRRGMVELARELHDKSDAPVILIGEETLPVMLEPLERIHNRMLDWVPARPATEEDVRHLARLYCPNLNVGEGVVLRITEASKGMVRRACVNLDRVREFADTRGLDAVDLGEWGDRPFFTGRPPMRRQ